MPIGVPYGSRVEIAAQFFDVNGAPTVPPSAAVFLKIAYNDLNFGPTTFSTNMLPIGETFIAAWNSSAASFGQAVISFLVGIQTLSPPDPILLINRNS